MVKNMSVEDAKNFIEKNAVTLIDVREKEETDAAYISGAQFAPLSNLIIAFNDCQIEAGKPVLFYCLKGGRSQQAAEFLADNILCEYEVLNMDGGVKEWVEKGFPIVKI